jgi:hypothetical protein
MYDQAEHLVRRSTEYAEAEYAYFICGCSGKSGELGQTVRPSMCEQRCLCGELLAFRCRREDKMCRNVTGRGRKEGVVQPEGLERDVHGDAGEEGEGVMQRVELNCIPVKKSSILCRGGVRDGVWSRKKIFTCMTYAWLAVFAWLVMTKISTTSTGCCVLFAMCYDWDVFFPDFILSVLMCFILHLLPFLFLHRRSRSHLNRF